MICSIFIHIVASLLVNASALANCNALLEYPQFLKIRELISDSEPHDFLLTLDDKTGFVIVTNNYLPENSIRLEALLRELDIDYEVLEFFGKTAFHIKRNSRFD